MSVDATTGAITFSNYLNLDSAKWNNARIFLTISSSYAAPKTGAMGIVAIGPHPCASQAITITAAKTINPEVKLKLTGFDGTYVLDTSYVEPTITVDLNAHMAASGSASCPITSWGIKRVHFPFINVNATTTPEWL